MEKKPYSPNFDLLKCLMMFGICFRHTLAYSGHASGCEMRLLSWCVPGFAFISGYFGVRFSIHKLLKLWGLALFLLLIPATLEVVKADGVSFGGVYLDYARSCWYLNAYTVLMLLAPILNKGLEALREDWRIFALPLGLLVCWSWAMEQWGVRTVVPYLSGMGQQSFFALLYAYILGGGYKMINFSALFGRWRGVVVGAALLALMPFLGMNTSPVTLVFVSVVVYYIEKLQITVRQAQIIKFISPSMFAVYLLHTNGTGFDLLNMGSCYLIDDCGWARYPAFIVLAFSVFSICVAVDLMRRGVICLFRRESC